MSFTPIYNDEVRHDASIIISYINPLGQIDTLMFTSVPPKIYSQVCRTLRPYEKTKN